MMFESIIKPRGPVVGNGWERLPVSLPMLERGGFPYEVWRHRANTLGVISSVEVAAEHPGAPPLGPAYHLSVSRFGARCSSADALWVLGAFDFSDALEDNHVPDGKVRNFWRYVADNLSGHQCACVAIESAIREDRGDYVWRGA